MANRTVDFKLRSALIVAGGLPCRVHCRSDGFTRLELEPLDGWVHLADDNTVAKHLAEEDHYHISLSTWPVDVAVWSRIMARWDGVETVVHINRVTSNGGAELAWTGLGSDQDVWQLYMDGSYSYKWFEHHYGLHISM
jgi:hypothetical protein